MVNFRWDYHFLYIALGHARMSKDPRRKMGAVIVDGDRNIRSIGFNGFPRGIEDTQERLHVKETKLALIVHAEVNAIVAAARVGVSTRNCTLYLAGIDYSGMMWAGPPCCRCTVQIIQAGITCIVTLPQKEDSSWAADLALSRELLSEAGVIYKELPLDGIHITPEQNAVGG